MEQVYHTPVLLSESIEGLNIKPNGVYVDVTFGGGGHSREILKHLTTGKLIAFDQDAEAAKNVPQDDRLIFVPQNFRFIKNWVQLHGFQQVDGILADLGVSSHQFDSGERGFSIRFNGPLDMRMEKTGPSAADLVNGLPERELADIIFRFGEERFARRIARAIIARRAEAPFTTTADLAALVRRGRTGQGEEVTTSLTDSMTSMLAFLATNYFANGQLPERTGNDHALASPYGLFEASDGQIAVAPSNDSFYFKYLQKEETILEFLNNHPIKHTKLYWLLSRCLDEEPEKRTILLI